MKRQCENIIAVGVIVTLTVLLLGGTLQRGYPTQLENYGSYMSQVRFLETNGGVWFTQNWYFGYEIGRYYPPLTTVLTYAIGKLFGDTALAFHLLGFGAYLVLGLGLYVFLTGEFKSRWAALVAVALFMTSHTVVISNQGYYWQIPRLLGYSLIPILLLLVRAVLRKPNFQVAIGIGTVLGFILLSNILAFTEAVLICGLYIVVKTVKGAKWLEWKHIGSGVAFGLSFLAVAGWWLIPAVLPQGFASFTEEPSNYPLQHLVDFGNVPSYRYYLLSLTSIPGVLALAGIASALRRRATIDLLALALLLVSLLLVVVQITRSQRFIFDGVLALSIMSGALIDQLVLTKWRWGILVATLIISVSLASAFQAAVAQGSEIRVNQSTYRDTLEYKVSSKFANLMQEGDVVYIPYADDFHGGPMAFNLFYPELAQVRGGFAAGNRNSDSGKIGDLIKSGKGPDQLDTLLKKYGVTYLVVNRPQLKEKGVFNRLGKRYEVVGEEENMVTLYTGYRKEKLPIAYDYLDRWRIAGLITSLVSTILLTLTIHFKFKEVL